ncbi:MAG: hypothetical protein CMK74_15100 [Pseudomonadales bacterium]|nr:hypothetical protein [Pseudomonadales bacterium]
MLHETLAPLLMALFGAAPLYYAWALRTAPGTHHLDDGVPLLCLVMLVGFLFLAPLGCALGDELYYALEVL